MLTAAQKTRVITVVMGFLVIAALLWFRLIWLQVLYPKHWMQIARRQHIQVVPLPPVRGAILDRNLKPLAVSLRLTSVFADPRHMKNPQRAARLLAPILNQSEPLLLQKFSQSRRGFVWLSRKIPNETGRKIRALKLSGVHLIMEPRRFYPQGTMASQLVGFAGMDMQGLAGLELAYNRILSGEPGWRWLSRDARSRAVGAWEMASADPRDGLELILTIDTKIQYMAEKALDRMYEKYRAKGAFMIVLNPMTGEVLAMVNRPTYDPNQFGKSTPDSQRNRAVTDTFEPGSAFKVVTASVALGTGIVRAEDQFNCENGEYPIYGRVLHDHEKYGVLTFREVIENSSNIGVAKAAMKVGAGPLYNGIRAFGFGEKTGFEIPGEIPGVVRPLKDWSKVAITSVPMGQGVAVNGLQMAQMICVIANGGTLVRPWVVREIRDSSGVTITQFGPKSVRRVISKQVAAQMQQILSGVVERGTGKNAAVPGYRAGGKTGTAQKVDATGQYSHSKFTASFVGFVPVEQPRLAIVVVLDEPRFPYYGGIVSAPAFKEVATAAMPYLTRGEIAPPADSGDQKHG